MRVTVASLFVQLLTFTVSIGESLGQQYEAWQEDAAAMGHAVHSATQDILNQESKFSKQGRHLHSDFHTVRTAVHETSEEDVNRSGHGRNGGSNSRHNTLGRRQDECKNSDIAECVGLLEVLTNKDLGFAASVDELNRMCPVLLDGLQCIDNYTRRCLTPKHREYFNKLYAGTIRVIKDLCNTRGKYQQEYIRHAPCMRQVNPKYNQCSEAYHKKTADLNQINDAVVQLSQEEKNRNVITLCCSFQEYLQCSERVVYETCGNETALFTKAFLDRMAGPIVQDICQAFSLSFHSCLGGASTESPVTFREASVPMSKAWTHSPREANESHSLEKDISENLVEDSVLQEADRESGTPLEEGWTPLPQLPNRGSTREPHNTLSPIPTSAVALTKGTTLQPETSLPSTPVFDRGSEEGLAGENSLTDRPEDLSETEGQDTRDGEDEDTELSASLTVQSPPVSSQVTHSMLRTLKTRELHDEEVPSSSAPLDDTSYLPVWPEKRAKHGHSRTATHSPPTSGQVELLTSSLKLPNSSSSFSPNEHTDSSVLTVSKVASSLFPPEGLDHNPHLALTNANVSFISALTFRPRLLSRFPGGKRGSPSFASRASRTGARDSYGTVLTNHTAQVGRDVHTGSSRGTLPSRYKVPSLGRRRVRIRHRRRHLGPHSGRRKPRRPHSLIRERITRKRYHRNVTVMSSGEEGRFVKGRTSFKPRRPIRRRPQSEGRKTRPRLGNTQEHLQNQRREMTRDANTTASPPSLTNAFVTHRHEDVVEKPSAGNPRIASRSGLQVTSMKTIGTHSVIHDGKKNSSGNPPRRPWRGRKDRRNRRPFRKGEGVWKGRHARRRMRHKHRSQSRRVTSKGVDSPVVSMTSRPPTIVSRTRTNTSSHMTSRSPPLLHTDEEAARSSGAEGHIDSVNGGSKSETVTDDRPSVAVDERWKNESAQQGNGDEDTGSITSLQPPAAAEDDVASNSSLPLASTGETRNRQQSVEIHDTQTDSTNFLDKGSSEKAERNFRIDFERMAPPGPAISLVPTSTDESLTTKTNDYDDKAENATSAYHSDLPKTRHGDQTTLARHTPTLNVPPVHAPAYDRSSVTAPIDVYDDQSKGLTHAYDSFTTPSTSHFEAISSSTVFRDGDSTTTTIVHEYDTVPEMDSNVAYEDDTSDHHYDGERRSTSGNHTSRLKVSEGEDGRYGKPFVHLAPDNSMDWRTSREGIEGGGDVQMGATPTREEQLWFRRRVQEEVMEAVFPAPTPVPYVIRIRKEQEAAQGFLANFTPVVLDVLESDFVPLMDPDVHRDKSTEMENDVFQDEYLTSGARSRDGTRDQTLMGWKPHVGIHVAQEKRPKSVAATGNITGPKEQVRRLDNKYTEDGLVVLGRDGQSRNLGSRKDLDITGSTVATTMVTEPITEVATEITEPTVEASTVISEQTTEVTTEIAEPKAVTTGIAKSTSATEITEPKVEVTTEITEPKTEVTTEITEPKAVTTGITRSTSATTEITEPRTEVTTEITEPKTVVTTEITEPKAVTTGITRSTSATTEIIKPKIEVTTAITEPKTEVTTKITEPKAVTTGITRSTSATTEITEPKIEVTTAITEPKTEVTTKITEPKAVTTEITKPKSVTTGITRLTSVTTGITEPVTGVTTLISEPRAATPSVLGEGDGPAPIGSDVSPERTREVSGPSSGGKPRSSMGTYGKRMENEGRMKLPVGPGTFNHTDGSKTTDRKRVATISKLVSNSTAEEQIDGGDSSDTVEVVGGRPVEEVEDSSVEVEEGLGDHQHGASGSRCPRMAFVMLTVMSIWTVL